MALEGKPWKFEQLGGAKRILVLSGWAAPFGAPRDQAVVRAPIRVRQERVFYGGGQNSTRHIFGVMYPDWEIRGRFRDRAKAPMGGAGFARAKTEEVRSFVKDQQEVEISWGDILVATKALIVEFDPGIEAEEEVEWVMRIQVDDIADVANASAALGAARPPVDYTDAIVAALNAAAPAVKAPAYPGDITDALDLIVGNINTAASQLLTAAQRVQSFKDATFAELNKMLSTLSTLGQTARVLRETFATIPLDAVTFQNNADAAITSLTSQTTVEEQMLELLNQSSQMERTIAVTKAGRAKGTVIARTSDTWESISTAAYGRPDRAGDIRDMNDIPAGANPAPGIEYLLPK